MEYLGKSIEARMIVAFSLPKRLGKPWGNWGKSCQLDSDFSWGRLIFPMLIKNHPRQWGVYPG